jgi:hypothetical protein
LLFTPLTVRAITSSTSCDDIQATLAELRGKEVEVAQGVSDQGWGLLAAIRLQDGSEFRVYESRHPSPLRT